MMQSEDALRLLHNLEAIGKSETENDSFDLNTLKILKFNYVIACQIYGEMQQNKDSKAADIDFLMQRHPNLRLAYIEKVVDSSDIKNIIYSSVLMKYSEREMKTIPVYRVRLPGAPLIGEGKPENQNHAIIYTRGRSL